jgi:hypothetical protein
MTCVIHIFNKISKQVSAYVSCTLDVEESIERCFQHLQMTHPGLKYEKNTRKYNEWLVYEEKMVKSDGWVWSSIEHVRKNMFVLTALPCMHTESDRKDIFTKRNDVETQTNKIIPKLTIDREIQTDSSANEIPPPPPTIPFPSTFGYAPHAFAPNWSRTFNNGVFGHRR